MILILSAKFRKHIALFLYGVLYSQLILAAESLRIAGPRISTYRTDYSPSNRRSASGSAPDRINFPAHRATGDERIANANDDRHAENGIPALSGLSVGLLKADSIINPSRHAIPEERVRRIGEIAKTKSDRPDRSGMSVNPAHSAFIGGPTQPEMQSFQSVNSSNMVDLFSGDFSYNIPLLDVGGYPVNIAYHSGQSMDEDASWTGLGWNVNPGSITRNMRGLPDDFNGQADTVKKVGHIKSNFTWGITGGTDVEIFGLPIGNAGLGFFHSTYNGWGKELSLNVSINAGDKSHGPLSGGLSITDNSQSGLTINPSLSLKYATVDKITNAGLSSGLNLSLPYNSRTGIKGLQLGYQAQPIKDGKKMTGSSWNTEISFANPSYNPTITLPMTNYNFSFTAKLGGEATGIHPGTYINGYVSNEYIAASDTSVSLPAFGYLNFQNRGGNWAALMDYNREKEIPYREKPAVPHIAVPSYTYDVFSISGEGTGGMFRPYRGDVGYIADHLSNSRTYSAAASLDLGVGGIAHGGTDLNANYSSTRSGPWVQENPLSRTLDFQQSHGLFEAAYFRNPGEKAVNSTAFYNAIGGDNVAVASLYQPDNSGPSIMTTNNLNLFNNKKQVGTIKVDPSTTLRNVRDKRTEVISYLTANEASVVGLDKYIYHRGVNQFGLKHCQNNAPEDAAGKDIGLMGYYFNNRYLNGFPVHTRLDKKLSWNWNYGNPFSADGPGYSRDPAFPSDNFSIRWLGRLKAPLTGDYYFSFLTDDGVRFWMNDTLLVDNWTPHSGFSSSRHVNLVAGRLYNIRIEYFEAGGKAVFQWIWKRPDEPGVIIEDNNNQHIIPSTYLFPPDFRDTANVDDNLVRENRVNNFRKASHISEIDVLNPDGRKYVYGIPVYNIVQKEVSFSVEKDKGNVQTGLTAYTDKDNSPSNESGKEGYYNREEIPAYAHSFLLTGILSPDYVDVKGDGISDDDIGDAVKFNYSKTSGIANPFGWRAPYIQDSANYNEGFRSYDRDDKANYIFGTKELWYLNAIESKTMIATFTVQQRADLLEINERGYKLNTGKGMCLKQIDLYSKADFLAHGKYAIPVKTVHFEYSYELCRGINQPLNDSGKLTLKKIWFTYNGNNKGAQNPYVFNYHPNNPRYKMNSSDKWGTYKDASQNPGATTGNPINNAEYPYALQDSAQAAYNAGAWALDSIQLPSGGRIKVNYESDDYAYVQNRRATQMCTIAGFGADSLGSYTNRLYGFFNESLYAYIKVPYTVTSKGDLYARYLEGIEKLFFRVYLRMPADDFGKGSEYVPCYARPDTTLKYWYGTTSNPNVIWIKLKGVNSTGDGDGPLSPLVQTAVNFLRLNLPSKAYPGSEMNDGLGFVDGLKIMIAMVTNITDLFTGFEGRVKALGWVRDFDVTRSFVRLNCPILKKYGGGHRVKSVLIYDNWQAMTSRKGTVTGKKESVYGQVYDYTTTQTVNGVPKVISSGVAAWEPGIGGEENPFHLPIEYVDQTSMLAPAAAQYTEEPLGETFFPGASVGYRNVKVKSIHINNTRSANGYSETGFYTTYDFPTTWDWSLVDNDSKKRFKPFLTNFLRINAKNYLTLSQGFKVELNDMNGKLRREAVYSQTDSANPISLTENFYKLDNSAAQFKHLNNTVTTIDPYGNIDTASTIGKDAELMTDMRDQTSTSIGGNINLNVDLFSAGLPVIVPTALSLFQSSTTQFRSAAMTKVIRRYGILDSVVHVDKGSLVSSKNLLYDSETGDPLLVRTGNEFNDSLFQFSYPSHWVYKGLGPAYQNIDARLSHLTLSSGKVTYPVSFPVSSYLSSGDELLVYSKLSVDTLAGCQYDFSFFPDAYKLWVVDTNAVKGGTPSLFLVDQAGIPFSGNDVSLRVIRSGHRNQNGTVGSITLQGNPLVRDGLGHYQLILDSTKGVLTAGANELQQYWKVADKKSLASRTSCVYTPQDSALAAAQGCNCMAPFFNYLIRSHRLFIDSTHSLKTVRSIVDDANRAGFGITLSDCSLLSSNADLPFYALTADSTFNIYMAKVGQDIFEIRKDSGMPMNLYNLKMSSCDAQGRVSFRDSTIVIPKPDTVSVRLYPDFSVNLLSSLGSACPSTADTLLKVDSTSDHLLVENSLNVGGFNRNAVSVLRFGQVGSIPFGAQILSAKMILQADQRGHLPGTYNNANSVAPVDSMGISLTGAPGWFPYFPLDTMLNQAYNSPWYTSVKNRTPFQNDTIDVLSWLSGYRNGSYYSRSFVLTQGSGPLHRIGCPDSCCPGSTGISQNGIPFYLMSGYGNYYSTFYSQQYADPAKWPAIQVTYVLPAPMIDTQPAILKFNSTQSCTTVTGSTCYSNITDTLVNPYQYGILGNFRPKRSYVYYGRRKESDPLQATNIRKDGTINGFVPFWTLQSGQWAPAYDTSRWVWNSQTSLFNRKGFELENKDPLGRFNSGQYGYGLTLPTAVIQNSRYQESIFEGFEDYGFVANSCDTACSTSRSFDFSYYQNNISDSMAHTGLYSLRVATGGSVSIPVPIQVAPDDTDPQLGNTGTTDACANPQLKGIRASNTILLPSFRPFAGKKMLVGAWVKEKNSCSCQSYSRDHIQLSFYLSTGDTARMTMSPSGNMIEGWQRYEAVVRVPANATGMLFTLQASDSSTTYFDDVRILPFNAEMKSYVYNPVNLRLMAELDENNYGTFYEYDDDGTLIRVKKETARGIQTIKETRSALLKDL